MSDRKLAVLGIVAVLMVGWAILQNRISRSVNTADFSSSALIEGLQIEAIAGVAITSEKGEKTTTLSRAGGGFVVAASRTAVALDVMGAIEIPDPLGKSQALGQSGVPAGEQINRFDMLVGGYVQLPPE